MDKFEFIPVNLKFVYAFLLKGEKTVIIDCGIPGSDKAILTTMSEHGIKSSDLSLILLTHGHTDHMGASSVLRKITGAKTAIHRADADIMRTGRNPALHPTNLKGKIFSKVAAEETVSGFTPYEPDILIDDELSLDDYGIDGRVIMTPGHTIGSISVLLGNGSIFVGDALMGGMMNRGKPNYPMYADDKAKAYDSIKRIISLSPKTVYTGHGGPFTLDEVKRNFKNI